MDVHPLLSVAGRVSPTLCSTFGVSVCAESVCAQQAASPPKCLARGEALTKKGRAVVSGDTLCCAGYGGGGRLFFFGWPEVS